MMQHRKLGLGTVQFGLDYGVSNHKGQVAEVEAAAILEVARRRGICLLDTAPTYGTAEGIIGRLLRPEDRFMIITKAPPLRAEVIGDDEIATIRKTFASSLQNMGLQNVTGLLVHQADDLLKPGGEKLFALLESWRAEGKVRKIGVSAYSRPQIEQLFERYHFDLVQLPLSVFDQRLVIDGTLETLARAGVEIHARSIFLQGLLLMGEPALPKFFSSWRKHFQMFLHTVSEAGTTPLEATLSFVKQLSPVSVALIGVLSSGHLEECIAAYDKDIVLDWPRYAINDPSAVDPRRWPSLR